MNQYKKLLEHLSLHSLSVLQNSLYFAKHYNIAEIPYDIVLYFLSNENGSIASEILDKSVLNSDNLFYLIEKKYTEINNSKISIEKIVFNKDFLKILIKALNLAVKYKHNYIGTEHLLMAIMQNKAKDLELNFKLNHKQYEKIVKQLSLVLDNNRKFPEIIKGNNEVLLNELNNFLEQNNSDDMSMDKQFLNQIIPNKKKNQNSILENFCINLTDPEKQKNIDPVIARDKEIKRIIQILSRRSKNNPVLLGDPGVGKTAIVEGLAKKIVEGDVPEFLLNKKIYSLDLTALISGTMYRGEFEARMKQLLDELRENPNVILFIDEIHNIMGSGSTSGSMDTANILKPALARGEIHCIGATTYEEYKKHIEKDAALDRRFQTININEPSIEDSIKILQGIKTYYENFHNVNISDEAIETAVQLSDRYLNNQFLPDKAIDLIDEASSNYKIEHSHNPLLNKIHKLENEIKKIAEEKDAEIQNENYSNAIKLQEKENSLLNELSLLQKSYNEEKHERIGTIQKIDIEKVLAQKLNVDLKDITLSSKKEIENLKKNLKKHIVGQDHAIDLISKTILKAKVGLHNPSRPLASFIFIGASGTGKTELAKILAKYLFKDKNALIRVDMSEFSESFNMSKLVGAPAGYVGFREENKLTDLVKKHPYSVVLFDEIEKAHSNIYNLLLSVLDEGYLTDATGKKINFKNTIIIFTSNLGSKDVDKKFGFDIKENDYKQNEYINKLKEHFPLEFLNRLDKVIIFNDLKANDLKKIIKIKLNEIKERLLEKNIKINYKNDLIQYIYQEIKNDNKAARAIDNFIRENIENNLAEYLISNDAIDLDNNDIKNIEINIDKKEIYFTLK